MKKSILCFVIFLFSAEVFSQRAKPDFIKIKIEDVSRITTIENLLTLPSNCHVKNFNFMMFFKGQTHFLEHETGDTRSSIIEKTKSKDFETVRVTGTWFRYLKHNTTIGSKFFIDSVNTDCPSATKRIYAFIVVQKCQISKKPGKNTHLIL